MTNPTVLDVIGGKKTIIQEYPTLPSSMPNEFMVGLHYATIPSSLKRTMTITIQETDSYDYTALINGTSGGISKTFNFNSVNNEKVTLSFKPATKADEDTLASYIPDGNITDISQLPSSLPAYLINVIPEVKVNGEVVLSGNTMRLGEELDVTMQAYIPGYGELCPQTHRTIAGSYLSLNVISQSVSPKKLQDLQTKLENTQTLLNSTQLASLTREDILGDMMYAGTLSYFAQLQAQSEIAGLASKAVSRLVASNGIFGYEPKVTYIFGMPQSISEGGIHLDIPMNMVGQSLDGNQEKTIQHIIQVGTTMSALEHQVPEQMFNTDPTNPVEAISAVKALQIANSQGQKIYQINQTNVDTVVPNLNLSSDIIDEIKIAVSQGKEVTAHTSNVSVPGWNGAGYIVINPTTGDGAYFISGGSNGGFAQIVFAIYALLDLALDNLDETSAVSLFFSKIISEITGLIGDIKDILNMYQDCGSSGAIQLALFTLMFSMMMTIFVGVIFLLASSVLLASLVGIIVVSFLLNYMQWLIKRSPSCQP